NLECLLAVVGLADQEVVRLDAELARVADVESMLRVDECGHAALTLQLRNCVERERRLTARLGAEDLDDAAARVAADAERHVETERAGRDDLDVAANLLAVLEAHDRSIAKFLLNVGNRELEGFGLVLLVHGWLPFYCALVQVSNTEQMKFG